MLGRALALLLGLFLAAGVSAESAPMMSVQFCELDEAGKTFSVAQDQYGEIPFLEADTFVTTPQGTFLQANMYLLVNPETKTFSIILVDPVTGVECLWLAGGELEPSVQGEPL